MSSTVRMVSAPPAVEIVPESGMYDYHARYTAGTTEFFCPARLVRRWRPSARSASPFIRSLD